MGLLGDKRGTTDLDGEKETMTSLAVYKLSSLNYICNFHRQRSNTGGVSLHMSTSPNIPLTLSYNTNTILEKR